MIIRELGMVVGQLDDRTLELTEVESARLESLINDWKKNGFILLAAPADFEQGKDGIRGDAEQVISFAEAGRGMIENKLLIEGFEIQTA